MHHYPVLIFYWLSFQVHELRLLRFLLLTLFSASLFAHPHNWIDTRTRLLINAEGFLTGIEQRWTFDPYYSALTLADLGNEYGPALSVGLQEYSAVMASNLASYNYFSNLVSASRSVSLPRPVHQNLEVTMEDDYEIMHLSMVFELSSPLDLKTTLADWSVYDPTYYIAMRHLSTEDVVLVTQGDIRCNKQLINATPSEEEVAYAQQLDASQRDTDGLGKLFAQHIKLSCSDD